MNAYRVLGTVAADRTITVRVPEASIGAAAEVIVLFDPPQLTSAAKHPFTAFLEDLRSRSSEPHRAGLAEQEQALIRELREEWD